MKKRIVALLMCGIMLMGSMAGCGKKEEPAPATPTAAPTEAATPTEEPETPSENEVVEEEEPTVVALPADDEDVVPEWVGTITAPEGYEDASYGTAPLSSVYLLLAYSSKVAGTGKDMDEMGLEGLTAEDFITKLDELFGLPDDKEETRKEYISMTLALSGLTDNSEEQLNGFFDGTWVPDGTDYMADQRDDNWNVNSGDDSFERENAYDTTVLGKDYKLWVEVSSFGTDKDTNTATGAVTYIFYTADGEKNGLTDKDFTAKYVGDLEGLTITGIEALATDAEDKAAIQISYEIQDVTGDEVVFENNFELTDSKGNIVEKNW